MPRISISSRTALSSGSCTIQNGLPAESLFELAARAKARWLRRVMYETSASSTQRCFAYVVAEHLNCVTLDAWPSQVRIAKLLHFESSKTVQRAAGGLEQLGELVISFDKKRRRRYAPVLLAEDYARIVARPGHPCAEPADRDDYQSSLGIHSNKSFPTAIGGKFDSSDRGRVFEPQQRGQIEAEVAKLLGGEGWAMLGALAVLGDGVIDRLCRSYAQGTLGERELAAARLAARQL